MCCMSAFGRPDSFGSVLIEKIILNRSAKAVAEPSNQVDWYRWNRTAHDHFIYKKLTHTLLTLAYSCFEFRWPLRDRTDILAVSHADTKAIWANSGNSLLAMADPILVFLGA